MVLAELQRKIDEARAVIARAYDELEGPACVTASFQASSIPLLTLLLERQADIPVFFIDTGYHFKETLEYRDEIARRLHLNLTTLTPATSVRQQETLFGILYASEPDRCCELRKVEPLFAALEEYGIWFSGLQRGQSPTRTDLSTIGDFRLPGGRVLNKVSPLANWSDREIWAFIRQSGLPAHPLYERGYTSIGCAPCTTLPPDPDNPRSGRWAGRKLECGIHVSQ